jgi:hypothetical protein
VRYLAFGTRHTYATGFVTTTDGSW